MTESQLETVTPTGEFLVSLYASLATLEKRQIAARTKFALRHLRNQGFRISHQIPYGWDLDPANPKKLVRNDAEYAVIARILELRQSGKSLGDIAQTLNNEKIPTKQGCRWGRGTIYALVKRETATTALVA